MTIKFVNKINPNFYFFWFLCCLFYINIIGVFSFFDGGFMQDLLKASLILLTVFSFYCKRKISINIILLSVIVCLLYFISLMVAGNNIYMADYFLSFITVILPALLLFDQIVDYYDFIDYVYKHVSFFVIPVIIVLLCDNVLKMDVQLYKYTQGIGYALLLPLLVCMFKFLTKRQGLLNLSVMLLFILIYASRGPLASFIVAFFILVFLNKKNKLFKYSLLFVCVFITFNSNFFINTIVEFLQSIGVDSRTLSMISNGSFINEGSGRDAIYNAITTCLFENPFLIRGIGGDAIFLGGSYSHNIIIEILFEFGFLIGGVLLLVGLIFIVIILIKRDILCILFLSCSFVPLLFSGTIWQSHYLFLAIYSVINKTNKWHIKLK